MKIWDASVAFSTALYISSLGEKFHRKSGGLLYSIDRSGGVTYALFMLNYDP